MVRFCGLSVAVAALVLGVLPLPAAADHAADVKDRTTLEEFVKAARAAVVAENPADGDALKDFADKTFKPTGRWHAGSIYLYILLDDGHIFFNAGQPNEGEAFWDVDDLHGTYFTRELIAAAKMGGGFVTYWFNNPDVMGDETVGSPKVGYAAELLTVDGKGYVIGSGIYPGADPDVTAEDVELSLSRPTLRAFVEGAQDAMQILDAASNDVAGNFFESQFRPEGDWRYRSIYLFVFEEDGTFIFHGGNEQIEGTNLWENVDKRGTKYVQELAQAARMGGDFVEYYFDNPDVPGDEEEGSLKTSFATLVDRPSGGSWIIGSGYYHAAPVPFAPPAAYAILALLLAGAGILRRRLR